ncbi:MAG: glycosyltransferase [Methyloligellaceae bacterium]
MSDYEGRDTKTWKDERLILTALAQQDFEEPFEIFLIQNNEFREASPDFLFEIIPDLKIVFSDESQSAKLKDHGVQQTTTEYVAVLEADCVPCREWLRLLVGVLRAGKEISVVSGRTIYGQDTMFKRCLSLTDRAFDDLGESGLTIHVSNNGALYRRSVLDEFPYPDAVTPFLSAKPRNQLMHEAGHQFYFERRAVMEHAIGGWDFVRDFRRNAGYADLMHYGEGQFSDIPRILYRNLKNEVSDCRRLGAQYLHWYDWPLTIFLLFFARILELPGMFDAVRRTNRIPRSSYR